MNKEERKELYKLQLLSDTGIPINKTTFFKMPTLRKVAEIGEKEFLNISGLFLMNYEVIKKSMVETFKEAELPEELVLTVENATEGEVILQASAVDPTFASSWTELLNLFLDDDILYDQAGHFFYSKKAFAPLRSEELAIVLEVGRVGFNVAQEDLDKQLESERDTAANERARKLQEKIRRNKERVAKHKKNKSTLFGLILGIAEQSKSLNLTNIWDLNYFQFTMLSEQTLKKEMYDRTIRMRDSGNFDLKGLKEPPHWTI